MILYKKLLSRYSRQDLKKLLGSSRAGRICRGELNVKLYSICSIIPLEQIGYTYEEWLIDFKFIYGDYKEKEILFNMLTKGYGVNALVKEFGISDLLFKFLKTGFIYHSKMNNLHKTFKILGIKPNLSNFKINCYETHIEVFGKKDDLESFKELYRLPFEIIYEDYQQSWHIAFDGCLAEFIKETSTKYP